MLPKVALVSRTDVTTVENPAVGLLVYNTQNSGTGNMAVQKDHYYYWNGVEWTNISNLTQVRRELLPQVFFIAEDNVGDASDPATTTPQYVIFPVRGENINVNPVVVRFRPSSVILNTGNHLTLNANHTISVNSTGNYEISGFINYNPQIAIHQNNVEHHTNV